MKALRVTERKSIKNSKELASKLSIPLLVSSYEEFFGHTLDSALLERDRRGVRTSSCAVCGRSGEDRSIFLQRNLE